MKISAENVLFAKRCIAEALINLMEKKDYQDISITEICKSSGYSRMAYYRNFNSKDHILTTYMNILADQFRKDVCEILPDPNSRSYEILLYAFRYFAEYSRFAKVLAKENLSSILQQGLNYYMDQYIAGDNPDAYVKYSLYYYAGGLFNLFTIWVEGDMKETPEQMAQIAYSRMKVRKPAQ